MMRNVHKSRCFTLIELLVVVAIIALLMGILLPTLTRVRQAAIKAACSSNLRQIGLAIQMYRNDHADRFPAARYMPPPFISTKPEPPLPEVLDDCLPGDSKVFKCPGDTDYVHKICGISYTYNTSLAGRQLDETWFKRRLEYSTTEIPVS